MKRIMNLSIGKKLMAGFGIVIALCLISSTVTYIFCGQSRGNVLSIQGYSNLQTTGNDLMDTFNEARINAATVCLVIDDEAYNSFVSDIAVLQKLVEDMSKLDMQFGGSHQAQLAKMGQTATEWYGHVERVQEINVALEEKKDGNYKTRDTLRQIAGQLYDGLAARMDNQANTAVKLINTMDHIFLLSSPILEAYDTGNQEAVFAELQAALDMAEALGKQDLSAAQQDNTVKIKELLGECKKELENYLTDIDDSDIAIGASLQASETIQLEALAFMDSIDQIMTDLVSESVTGSEISMAVSVSMSVLVAAISVLVALFLIRNIKAPLNRMRDLLTLVGETGQMDIDPRQLEYIKKDAECGDEVGQSVKAFHLLLDRLTYYSECLTGIADGDLCVDVKPSSEKDSMGTAMKRMIDKLNKMFKEIGTASSMVTAAASQVSMGAQSLADGSTTQAASVEQFNVSITEVSAKTNHNADMAKQAFRLSSEIKSSAEKGSIQMEQMMQAVKEINEASSSIGRVIKVIDDIAFQTNILALNAAVEAARAGQHGKGFAVVADEVRNLAAKSAVAAKDTGSLIENTIEKANLGYSIASETSVSLLEIVDGINKSAEIVELIARSSDEQAVSIEQINQGIDGVVQVVHQNSATAEESAAASEEMSSQSILLQELVHQFKIKDSNTLQYIETDSHVKNTGRMDASMALNPLAV